jgi:hypothetical protein
VSLFVPESVNKLHDGAVIIRNLRIAKAGVFFPMPESRIVDTSLGSRHRAALGITDETDAVVVVVSEERGTISFCFSGNIVSNLDGASLRQALLGLFGRKPRKKGGKKITTPMARASYAATPSRPIGTPTPSPVAVGPLVVLAPSPVPSPAPPPVSDVVTVRHQLRHRRDPRRAQRAMPGGEETEASPADPAELPESPPPKGRGASSPEEANN